MCYLVFGLAKVSILFGTAKSFLRFAVKQLLAKKGPGGVSPRTGCPDWECKGKGLFWIS
jgi:hypothetical protein